MVEKLTWKQARKAVMAVNPELAREIDKLDPGDDYLLIKARYPFGCNILDKGVLHIPTQDGQVCRISDSNVDPKIKGELAYAKTMPIGVVLNRVIELYLTVYDRIIPFSMMAQGKIFALWSALEISESAHLGRVWSIMAGARSLIMLPKISDVQFYKKVKREFGLRSQAPHNLLDQWNVFSELAQHPEFPDPWFVELLFFTEKWMQNHKDEKWKLFQHFLMKTSWHETAYLRNQVVTDFAFSCALAEKNLKPNPYLTDTVKHLYSIGIGAYPGFVMAEDNLAAPVSSFQEIFSTVYNLRYFPTMVHGGYFSASDPKKPCYYSLEFPTLMTFSPKSRQNSSKREDLREIAHLMTGIKAYLLEDKLGLANTPIEKWAKRTNYHYFHTEPDEREAILDSSKIVGEDKTLEGEHKKYNDKAFCASSPFLRGCVRISTKDE